MPEIIFWHIPTKAYKKVAPSFLVRKRCVGSIFLEDVAAQEAEMGIMKVLEERPSVKVSAKGCIRYELWLCRVIFLKT